MRLAILAAGLVAACTAAPPETPVTWQLSAGGSEASLLAADAQGPVLQMTCLPAGKRMELTAFRLTPVASNEEFAFGADEEGYLFVADPTAGGPGVTASGPIMPPVLDALLSGGAVSAVYGTQRLGPLILPPDQGDIFAGACRGML